MNTLTPSRRNVMRALAAITTGLPTLAYATPTLVCVPVNEEIWQAASSAERSAFEASERYYAAMVEPAVQAHDAGAGSFDSVREQEDAWGNYTSAHADAVDALILTPAPTLEAVAHKLRLGIDNLAFDGTKKSFAMVEAIAADVDRLGGRA